MKNKKQKIDSEKIVKELISRKKELAKFSVKKIGIFGSFANGKQKKKSDLDILVVLEKPNFDNYMDLKLMLEETFGRKIDLVIEEDLKPELKHVKKEAKYARL